MKWIVLVFIALGLVACTPEYKSNNTSASSTYEEYGEGSVIVKCSDSNGTDCSVYYRDEIEDSNETESI